MKAEKAFENTVKKVFGDTAWDEIQEMYKNVIDNRNNGKKCGKYGDDCSTIVLMLRLRKNMREMDLVTKNCIDRASIIEFFKDKENWLTDEYRKRFPVSWESEPEVRLCQKEYDFDAWDYRIIGDVDKIAEREWIVCHGRGNNKIMTHYYYNQLDHYLTYLTGAIRRNENAYDRIKNGAVIKIDLCQEEC